MSGTADTSDADQGNDGPSRVLLLLPGVTGELLKKCRGDAAAANAALRQLQHRSAEALTKHRIFSLGSEWTDLASVGRLSCVARVVRSTKRGVTFVSSSGATFTLCRDRARRRMRFYRARSGR